MKDIKQKLEKLKKKLTPKQELFCRLYVSKEFFGNGVQSYIEAYNVNLAKKGAYNVALKEASKNLIKPHIYNYINALLEDGGLNDIHVDKQLLFIINQHNDLRSKIAAIKEYNQLKARIKRTPLLGDKDNPVNINLTTTIKEIKEKNERELQKIAGGSSNITNKS